MSMKRLDESRKPKHSWAMTPLWALRVHSFDSEDAVRSLEGQLLLLRTLAQQPADLSLTWRLTVEPGRREQAVSAEMSLLCETHTDAPPSPKGGLELASLASVVLAAGHNLSLDRHPAQASLPRSCRLLAPASPTQDLPIKADWAVLVDLLRHRGEKVVVDITCRPVTAHGPDFAPTASSLRVTTLSSEPAAAFLAGLPIDTRHRTLELSVSVYTPTVADELLYSAISYIILGIPTIPVTRRHTAKAVLGVTPEEALRVWHSPYARLQGRGLTPRPPSLSSGRDLSRVNGVAIGETNVQGPDWDRPMPLRLAEEARLRHVYIIGKTGVGKTNILKNIAQQDIERGAGVAVLSPHADLIDHLLATSGERHKDVTYLDFGDATHVPLLNPLTMDIEDPRGYSSNSARVIELFTKRTFNQFAGPVFTDAMRLAIDSVDALKPLTGPKPTLVAAVELVRSDKLQRWASRQLKENRPDLSEEWERIFNMRGSEAAETSRWVTAKFSDLSSQSALRAITSGIDAPPFSIRDIYRSGKVLLVKLPETRMPSISSSLLGSLLFSSIYREAQLVGPDEAVPFYVHVDEFQRFVTGDLEELVAEARKFKLGLTFAHQNLRQLESFSTFEGASNPRLAEAIFSNVGTIVAMKTSGRDVAPISQELSVSESTIRGLVRGQAVVRTTHESEDVICTVRAPLAKAPSGKATHLIHERMLRDRIWVPAEDQHRRVEAMITEMRSAAAPRVPAVGDGKTSEGLAESGNSFLDDWLAKRKQRPELEPATQDPSKRPPKGRKTSMKVPGETA